MKKMLVALGLLAAVAVAAWAQTSGTNTQERNGYYFNATTGAKTDADGNAYVADADRDRDYSTPKTLVGPVNMGPGRTVTSTAAVSVGEYTSLLVMVSWNTAAAADSDSVALAVKFIGKISTDMNDGYDYLIGSLGDTCRSFVRVDSTASVIPAPTAIVVARMKPPGAGGATHYYLKPTDAVGPKLYYINPGKIVFSDGRNGVAFPLAAPSGAPFKFSHLAIAVTNHTGTVTLQNVKVEVWPKVN